MKRVKGYAEKQEEKSVKLSLLKRKREENFKINQVSERGKSNSACASEYGKFVWDQMRNIVTYITWNKSLLQP